MERIILQRVLLEYGYNTADDVEKGNKLIKSKNIVPQAVSIYLKNRYVVHLKPEYEIKFKFFGQAVDIDIINNGKSNHIVFNADEVATIQVKKEGKGGCLK